MRISCASIVARLDDGEALDQRPLVGGEAARPAAGSDRRRPGSRPARRRARGGRRQAVSSQRERLTNDSGVQTDAGVVQCRRRGPRVHDAQLDGAGIDRADRQRPGGASTGRTPTADPSSTWKRVPPASPDVHRLRRGAASPKARSAGAVSTSARVSSSKPAAMPAAPSASLRTCSSAGGADAQADPRRARFVDLRLRQQQPLGGADGAGIDARPGRETPRTAPSSCPGSSRQTPAPRVTRDANSVAARRRSTWSRVSSSRRASSHAGSAPSSRVRARSCCL